LDIITVTARFEDAPPSQLSCCLDRATAQQNARAAMRIHLAIGEQKIGENSAVRRC